MSARDLSSGWWVLGRGFNPSLIVLNNNYIKIKFAPTLVGGAKIGVPSPFKNKIDRYIIFPSYDRHMTIPKYTLRTIIENGHLSLEELNKILLKQYKKKLKQQREASRRYRAKQNQEEKNVRKKRRAKRS